MTVHVIQCIDILALVQVKIHDDPNVNYASGSMDQYEVLLYTSHICEMYLQL